MFKIFNVVYTGMTILYYTKVVIDNRRLIVGTIYMTGGFGTHLARFFADKMYNRLLTYKIPLRKSWVLL